MNKYDFIIQYWLGAKHQNADSLSRMCLTKCGWTECPDGKNGILVPFADEDESMLTRHNDELIIGLPPEAADEKAYESC